MADAFVIATHALQGDMQQLSVIGNNMVNASTTGYKRDVAVRHAFSAHLANSMAPAAASPGSELAVDVTRGALVHTGRPLDVAIDGDAYFEVAGPHGSGYTRNGSFTLDSGGRLVASGGEAVAGQGGDIVANGGALTIQRDGQVMQGDRPVGQIKLVSLAGVPLHKGDDGLLHASGEVQVQAGRNASLRIGYLEASNVSSLQEMVVMMETSRNFEALQHLVQGYDEQLGAALQKLGDF